MAGNLTELDLILDVNFLTIGRILKLILVASPKYSFKNHPKSQFVLIISINTLLDQRRLGKSKIWTNGQNWWFVSQFLCHFLDLGMIFDEICAH